MTRCKLWLIIGAISVWCVACSNASRAIKVGSVQQLTGLMAKYGKTHQSAVIAEMEEINQGRLEKGGPQIQVIFEDDQLHPATGVAALRKLIDVDHVSAVIGAQGSSVTLAMAPVAEASKVVLISGASGAPKISQAGDYVFRTCPSDLLEGAIMAEFYLEHLAGKRIAVVYINNDYGQGLRKAFIDRLGPSAPPILDLAYKQGDVDFRTQLTRIRQERTGVVYVIGYEEMVNIYRQAKELGVACQWLGNNQLNDQSLIDKMGTTADGTVFPGHKFMLDEIKKTRPEFYRRYLHLSNGVELDVFAAYGAEALQVIDFALSKGARTGTEIKDVLDKLGEFHGLNGDFHFDQNGDAVRSLSLYQIRNGKIVGYQQ
jgi:branched-chain amino acid transport system substrate-binding protein